MRIFLTGGSGYIGSAVLDAFVRAGHTVDALVRNSEKAALVQARGGHPILGDLSEPASYADAAAAADGVVHTASEPSPRRAAVDATAIDVMLSPPTRGQGRFVIYTSGIWVLGNCASPADETAPLNPVEIVAWRPAHEAARAGRRDRRHPARSSFARASSTAGRAASSADLFKDAANSLVRVVGSGDNHWPLVYDRDLAELYVRLAVHPDASGVFHANDEGDERVNDLVAAIAEHAPTSPASGTCRSPRRGRRWARSRRARARSDRAEPARPRARLEPVTALGRGERGAALRGMAPRQGSGAVARCAYLNYPRRAVTLPFLLFSFTSIRCHPPVSTPFGMYVSR